MYVLMYFLRIYVFFMYFSCTYFFYAFMYVFMYFPCIYLVFFVYSCMFLFFMYLSCIFMYSCMFLCIFVFMYLSCHYISHCGVCVLNHRHPLHLFGPRQCFRSHVWPSSLISLFFAPSFCNLFIGLIPPVSVLLFKSPNEH